MKKIKGSPKTILPAGNILVLTLGIFLMLSPNFAEAQDRWNLAIRSGINFPTRELGGANLNTGFGFDGTVAYRFLPHLSATTGWAWNRFSAEESFAGDKVDFEETGYILGLHFLHPVAAKSRIHYMIGASGLYNHIEVENSGGEIISDSGHGWGWQAEAGLSFPLLKSLNVVPGLRFRSLSREIKVDDSATEADLNYLSAGLAFSWVF